MKVMLLLLIGLLVIVAFVAAWVRAAWRYEARKKWGSRPGRLPGVLGLACLLILVPASWASVSVWVAWRNPSTGTTSNRVFRDGRQVAVVRTNNCLLKGLNNRRTYRIEATALDAAGRESARSAPLTLLIVSNRGFGL